MPDLIEELQRYADAAERSVPTRDLPRVGGTRARPHRMGHAVRPDRMQTRRVDDRVERRGQRRITIPR